MFIKHRNSNKGGFTPIVDFDDVSTPLKRSSRASSKFTMGFTLIELLVVVAIIGILASVVIASLNTAREKGKIASIKSTLKNLGSQMELNYLENGSYAGTNPSNSDLSCTGTASSLSKIAQPLIDQGVYVKCFSNGSGGDVGQRYGATALIYDTNELKAWSVSEKGVVRWDAVNLTAANLPGGDTKSWSEANTACTNNGGRLPSMEELRTLSHAYYSASGNTSYTPTGLSFSTTGTGGFWSSSVVPYDNSIAYYVHMGNGLAGANSLSYGGNVHCVR